MGLRCVDNRQGVLLEVCDWNVYALSHCWRVIEDQGWDGRYA